MSVFFEQFKMYIILALFALLVAAFVGTGVYAYRSGAHTQALEDSAEQVKQMAIMQKQVDAEKDRRNTVETEFMNQLSKIQIVNTTVNRNFKTETEKTIYTTCVVPQTGVDLLNTTADTLNAQRTGGQQ